MPMMGAMESNMVSKTVTLRNLRPYPWRVRVRVQLVRAQTVVFAVPALALVGVFMAVPLVYSIKYSFTSWNGVSPPKWIGLANYRFLYHFGDFHRIFFNNLVLVAGVVVWVALPFLLALLLHRLRGANVIRTVLLVPILLPPVVVGALFRLILANNNGALNGALRSAGLGFVAAPWLEGSNLVLFSVVSMIAWAYVGLGVLFYSAGLSAVPLSYVEAAEIEGARWRQLAWYVYRPALRPLTQFWVLILTISTVTSFFPWIVSLTGGGPGVASTTLDYEVYVRGIVNGQYGLGSAIAVVGLVFITLLIVLQLAVRKIRKTYE